MTHLADPLWNLLHIYLACNREYAVAYIIFRGSAFCNSGWERGDNIF